MLRGLVNQLALPVAVPLDEVARKRSFGAAITLTYELAGFTLKDVQTKLKSDKAQVSRWESGCEGIIFPKLVDLMDACGNDTPVLWMPHQRGYDLASVRRRETELERRLRLKEEECEALKRVLMGRLG